ncbi:MAG: response regulator [Gammaproteobacteria bacterium]|nr:response regulator [Gammaproteobacteria bacterium]
MKNAYHILVVEDNAIVQRTTRETFERQGHQAWVASNASEAMLMANTQPFSLILMDVGLPDGDGLEVSAEIRSSINCPNRYTPIVVITAHFTTADAKQRCTEIGINLLLQKPVYGQMLLNLLAGIEPYAHYPLYDEAKAIALHHNARTAQRALQLYLEDLAKERINLDRYYQDEDWERLRKVIHKQHGAGLYCGTTRLNACLDDVESLLNRPLEKSAIDITYQYMIKTMKRMCPVYKI